MPWLVRVDKERGAGQRLGGEEAYVELRHPDSSQKCSFGFVQEERR